MSLIKFSVSFLTHEDGYCSEAEFERQEYHPYYIVPSKKLLEIANENIGKLHSYPDYYCGVGSGYCGSYYCEEAEIITDFNLTNLPSDYVEDKFKICDQIVSGYRHISSSPSTALTKFKNELQKHLHHEVYLLEARNWRRDNPAHGLIRRLTSQTSK